MALAHSRHATIEDHKFTPFTIFFHKQRTPYFDKNA